MRRLTVAARVWGFHRAAAGAAVMIGLWRAVTDPIHVVGRSDDVLWVAAPLVPAIIGALVPATAEVAYSDQERLTAQPARLRRLGAVLGLTVLGVGAALLGGGGERWIEYSRNVGLALGLGLLATWALPRSLNWLPVVGYTVASWLIGAAPAGQPPAAWALLLHGPDSPAAMAVAAGLYAAGAGIYLLRPGRLGG